MYMLTSKLAIATAKLRDTLTNWTEQKQDFHHEMFSNSSRKLSTVEHGFDLSMGRIGKGLDWKALSHLDNS